MLKLFLIVLLAFNVFASAWGAVVPDSECQKHSKRPDKTGTRVNVRCDELGLYEPLQCTEDDPDICACYNQTGPVTDFQLDLMACECPIQRYLAQQNGVTECEDIPVCADNGFFFWQKCCPDDNCWCQDTRTGQRYLSENVTAPCEMPEVVSVRIVAAEVTQGGYVSLQQ